MNDINKALTKYSNEYRKQKIATLKSEMINFRRKELNELISKYGFDRVAIATGLTIGTLQVYLKSKAQTISDIDLTVAKNILREFHGE